MLVQFLFGEKRQSESPQSVMQNNHANLIQEAAALTASTAAAFKDAKKVDVEVVLDSLAALGILAA